MGSHRRRPEEPHRRLLLQHLRMREPGRTLVVAQGLTGCNMRR